MKHLKQTLAAYVYSHCNICNIPIYYCNIYPKHLQYTFETSAIIKTYVCNMGGEAKAGPFRPSGWEAAACDGVSTTGTGRARGCPLTRLETT
jgi:hypothetical protein